jgi:hypothetical protein
MSKLDDWAAKQWAGMKLGATEVGRDIVADVGTTYQAFLMGDAGWRVPRAHGDFSLEIAEEATAAEIDREIAEPAPDPGPSVDMDR